MKLAREDDLQTPAMALRTVVLPAEPVPSPAAVAAGLMFSPLVRHLRRAAIDVLNDELAPFGLRPLEALLLRLVRRQKLDTDSLCRLAAIDMVTFSRAIRRLQTAQFVDATRASSDRRRRIYELTRAGTSAATDIAAAVQRGSDDLLATLALRERQRLMRLLTHFLQAHASGGAVPQDTEIVALLGGAIDIYTLLRRARQITVQVFEDECGALGMTAIETGAIDLIARFGPLPIKDLPKLLAINRGSAIPVIGKLRDSHVLDTETLGRRYLALSETGLALQRRLREGVSIVNSRVLDVFSAAERTQLLALMRQVYLATVSR